MSTTYLPTFHKEPTDKLSRLLQVSQILRWIDRLRR